MIGAGAAGLLAAAESSRRKLRTLLVEKNPRPGVKILMSGGTRCNLTQDTDGRGIVEAFGKQGRFLYPALTALGPADVRRLVEACGVRTKVEPGGKVFPASDRAADVLAALLSHVKRSGAEIDTGEAVASIRRGEAGLCVETSRRVLVAPRVIVTTGGASYPGCGTTGDGYGWARGFGHSVVPPRPALVPITTDAGWVRRLRGVTVPDAAVTLGAGGVRRRTVAAGRGSLLFAHFGLSGPVILDLSGHVTAHPRPAELDLRVDFLPDMPEPELLAAIRSAPGRSHVATAIPTLPRRLADALLAEAGVPANLPVARLDAASARRVAAALKAMTIPVSGTLGFRKAEVTAGGVALAEVDPRTLESRLVPGLHFAGEVLDLDGRIGGYNFQAAFSTGYLAGASV